MFDRSRNLREWSDTTPISLPFAYLLYFTLEIEQPKERDFELRASKIN